MRAAGGDEQGGNYEERVFHAPEYAQKKAAYAS